LAISGAPIPTNGFHKGRSPDNNFSKDHDHHGINCIEGVPQNNAFPVKITGASKMIGETIRGKLGSLKSELRYLFIGSLLDAILGN
jgi:hypothetical protein